MRGQTARALRKMANKIGEKNNLPERVYETRIHRKVYKVPQLGTNEDGTPKEDRDVVLEIPVVNLGNCIHGLYKHLKKLGKRRQVVS